MLKNKTIKNKYYIIIIIIIFVLCSMLVNSIFAKTEIGTARVIGHSESEEEIIQLVTKYYTDKNESLLTEEKYNTSNYFNENSFIEKYVNLKNEYYLNNRKSSGISYLWSSTEIKLNSIKVVNDEAEVSIEEVFSCQYEGREQKSSIGITHIINLEKVNGAWKINDICSTDEFDRVYKEMEISEVEKILNEAPTVASDDYKAYMAKKEKEMAALLSQLSSTKSWTLTTYDRTDASDYALEYSLNTSGSYSYNSLFVNCTSWGGDCQNFGSQSIFVGFGGDYDNSTAINNKDLPMIESGDRAWWATSSSVVDIDDEDSIYGNGAHWSNCVDFGEYADGGGSGIEGVYGWIYTGSVDYVYPGDIIQYRSTTSGDNWSHSYVVTSITGTQGQLDPDDIYVCSHTVNLNDILLDDRESNEAKLRVIRIGWHYNEN